MKEYRFGNYSVEYHESIDSTNTYAKERARNGAPNGSVIIASHQSAGRGRMGRSFFSPESSGIYMSVLFRNVNELKSSPGRITSFAAVCVCDAINDVFGIDAQIKWVNDVMINEKKVCGILTESSFDASSASLEYVVVGIGINVERTVFPAELSDIACSIKDYSSKNADKSELAAEILQRLAPLLNGAIPNDAMERYRALSCLLGKEIFTLGEGSIKGKAITVNDEGALIVETEGGETVSISAGEVSVRAIK